MPFWRRILGLECPYLDSNYCSVPRGEGCERNAAENYFEIGEDAGCYRDAEDKRRLNKEAGKQRRLEMSGVSEFPLTPRDINTSI